MAIGPVRSAKPNAAQRCPTLPNADRMRINAVDDCLKARITCGLSVGVS